MKELDETGGLAQTHFTFAADAEQRVPGILVKQAKSAGRRPVVVALHGTGGNKESQQGLLKELTRLGFIGVAIDGRYHGERTRAGKGASEYNEAILRAYRTGHEHPFLYDTAWDVMRLIDYGDSDPRTPAPGVTECATRARQAYANAGAEDKFHLLIQEKTGHAVTPAARQAAIAWFAKWLNP
jgi:predicted esterase